MRPAFAASLAASILLSFISTAFWNHGARSSTEPLTGGGAFIAISVKDVAASTRWYEENLGLRILKKGVSPRGDAGNVVLAGNSLYIELMYLVRPELESVKPPSDESLPPGIRKAGVVLDSDQFDELFDHLRKKNAQFRGGVFEDKEMKLRSFIVVDNEGNLIQFFAPLIEKSK
jgi:catechol 2,3-dioxygenase-like lactoylglutathione lyase family enzyme